MPVESMHDDIASAIAELSGGNNDQGQRREAPAPSPSPAPATREDGQATQGARNRDATGRFAPTTPAKDAPATDGQQATQALARQPVPAPSPVDGQQATQQAAGAANAQAASPSPQQAGLKAPVSWTPDERQGWEAMDPKAQAAVLRRDREVDNVLRQTADVRRYAQELNDVIQPYMPMIAGEGSTPARAVAELFRTAAFIRTAPPLQKAAAIADLIFQHGVDIPTLDAQLSQRAQGRPYQQNPQENQMRQMQQMIQQQLAPVQQFMQGIQSSQQNQVQQTLQQFMADPQNEFVSDPEISSSMADQLEIAARRGQQLSLQEAYRRATLWHPTYSEIIQRRSLGDSAAQQSAAAARATNAAVSVKPSGGAPSQGNQDESDGSLRGDILSSMTKLSRNSRV